MKIVLIITILLLLSSCKALSESNVNQDVLYTKSGKTVSLDWNNGEVIYDGDIKWNIHSCGSNEYWICLVVEGLGIDFAFPMQSKVGDSWYFDGRLYYYALETGTKEKIILSRFSKAFLSSDYSIQHNKVSVIRMKDMKLLEYISYGDSGSEHMDAVYRSEGLNLVRNLGEDKWSLITSAQIEKCMKKDAVNCLGR